MSAPPPDYIEGFVCTLATCDIKKWGYIHYQPSMAGNVLFLVLILLIAVAQLVLGIKYKIGGLWVTCMILGLASESIGYVARILMHPDPFNRVYFLIYLICLTLGPVFIAASIYLCLGRVVVIYGNHISRIRPHIYTLFFMGCDSISLVVQAVGGGIAASFPVWNKKMIDLGTHILVAGLSFQVASLFAFSVCSIDFLIRVKRNPDKLNPDNADLYNSKKFKIFLASILLATSCLFVRTVFRSVELSEGFSGKPANNETQFMVLDGVMVILASLCLTFIHPGIGIGKEAWQQARFSMASGRPLNRPRDDIETAEYVAPKPKMGKYRPNITYQERTPVEIRE